MVFRVGLTGGIASGKTTVSGLFEQHGIDIIDADLIARELSQPGTIEYMAIVKQFGETCLLSDGQLNRPLLRQLIFSDPQARQALEGILHPSIFHPPTPHFNIFCATVPSSGFRANVQSSIAGFNAVPHSSHSEKPIDVLILEPSINKNIHNFLCAYNYA